MVADGKIQTVAAFESPFISSTRRIALGAFAFSNSGNTGNAGKILISSLKGDINIAQDINTRSYTFRGEKTGDGGMINIYSKYGNVTASGRLSSSSRYGNGGEIIAVSDFGNLEIDSFISSSNLNDSGTILFSSKHGNIRINNTSFASSNSTVANAGNGGDIIISSRNGLIEVDGSLLSNSSVSSAFFGFAGLFLPSGDTGDGGNIHISSTSGNIIINGNIDSSTLSLANFSTSGIAKNGGRITVNSLSGDITINGTLKSSSTSTSAILISGESRDGGDILISSKSGNLEIKNSIDSSSFSVSENAGRGGDIHLASESGNIKTNRLLNSSSFSISGLSSGNGGGIHITAPLGRIIGDNVLASLSVVREGGTTGSGGNINLTGQEISGLELITVSAANESGDVTISGLGNELILQKLDLRTSGELEIPNPSNITGEFITLNLDELGPPGDIFITGMGNITLEGVTIQSNANGGQPAGNITLISPGIIKFIDSQINSNSNDTSTARAGNIIIDTAHLNLGNASLLSAETSSIDDGGNIIINATESVSLGEGVEDFSPVISVEASGAGRPGNIEINTPNFRLAETARITATSQVTATNKESGGSVTLNADRLDLAGTVEILAETEGQSPGGILTLRPYQINPDLDINLFPNARISASTSGSGPGGTLRLSAPENISIHGPGLITALTRGSGPAGTLQVRSQQLTLADGAQLSTSTESIGQGGNIDIATRLLNLDQGTIAVRSTGSGNSGSINLNAQQAMLLRNNSSIETDAGGSLGNGGNIDITTPFLLSLPDENNDIIANAIGGDGGQINITANNIFNFDIQDGRNRTLLRDNITNDISASSETGTSGTIALNTLNVNPAENVAELPTDLIDASSLIDNSLCTVGNKSKFLVTGRGGFPESPNDTLSAIGSWEDWNLEAFEEATATHSSASLGSASNHLTSERHPITEAQQWRKTSSGSIVLYSDASATNGGRSPTCRQLKDQL